MAKISRKAWRTRCISRKCSHESSDTFRAQHRAVSSVGKVWLERRTHRGMFPAASFWNGLAEHGRAETDPVLHCSLLLLLVAIIKKIN